MSDLIIFLLIIVVSVLFLLLAFAPPRRERDPNEKKEGRHRHSKRKRQVRRTSTLRVLRDFIGALFGDEREKTFEGEPIVHRTRRHWVVLLIRGFGPALVGGLVG